MTKTSSPSKAPYSAKKSSPTSKKTSPSSKKKRSPTSSAAAQHPLQDLVSGLKRKDDYLVSYYFAPVPLNGQRVQADRDFVAQAMSVFAVRTKRDGNLTALGATQLLDLEIQGVTGDKDAAHPVQLVFKTAKHIWGMAEFLRSQKYLYNNVGIFVSVDKSPFIEV